MKKLQGPWIKRILMLTPAVLGLLWALGFLGDFAPNLASAFHQVFDFFHTHKFTLLVLIDLVVLSIFILFLYSQRDKFLSLTQQLSAHTLRTPLAICVWDKNFKVIDWNENAEKLFGYTKAEALGKRGSDLIIPAELQSQMGEILDELLQAKGGFRSTNENITKDGRRIICDWYNTPIKNSKGEVIAITSLALDVSERLRSAHTEQQLLRKSREEQAALVYLATHKFVVNGRVEEAIPLVTEVSSKILTVARSSVWLFSSDRQELVCSDIFDTVSRQHLKGSILRAADYPSYFNSLFSGRAIDAESVGEDARTREFNDEYLQPLGISSMLDATIRIAGKVVGVVRNEHIGPPRKWSTSDIAFSTDVADLMAQILVVREREDALQALRQSEETFRQLTENIKGVFWLTSPDKKIAYYISPAFHEIWGRGPGYYYSDPMQWIETVHPDDRNVVLNAIPLQPLGKYDIEYRIIRPDGSIRWIRDRAFPIFNLDKQVIRIAGICDDITENKAALESRAEIERQLQQAQKMEALGRLAGGIAHDFNNILSAINGYAQLLRQDVASDSSKISMIDAILAGAERAKNLVKQILAFSRQSDLKLETVNFAHLVEEACKLINVTLPKNISLITNLAEDCFIKSDPSQIFQVVMNLCANAVYAMKEKGGVLTLDLQHELGRAGEPGTVLLKVRDTGDGIPQEIRDRIFDPFFTTKPIGEGTGLGLSVVHGVINKLGGSIDVSSSPGLGTEFYIRLPYAQSDAKAGVAPPNEKLITKSAGTILFVDDEEMIGNLFSQVLTRNGYQVLLARDAAKALEIIRSNPQIELLITDLTMPGLSGIDLIKKAKALRPEMLTILCSGYDPGAISTDVSSLIASRLWKPFSIQELLGAIREAFGQSPDTLEKRPALRLVN